MKAEAVIPVLRMFDYQKAKEFYVDWLGFDILWEHTFDENFPVYMEVQRDNIKFHLSEHHGDGTPGTHVFIWCDEIESFHKEISVKNYKYNKPGLEKTFYGALAFTVTDPFGNNIIFNQKLEE
ncbi:VOC family protein [Elizabethkingia meningoseptica]|uniref:glyoxalase superfamily protein n=1 Tax=Elizabethkingia meningoseptica TaxID=238 RepID=UPI000332CB52|nr:glyoxalase superfamily protein [Elizabethkingia meningoseptica]AQX05492.1 bleomycin resistance protein [Elizabethkingia meningoseptica]AQX47536.1 bleomycin resistance protein [Elizabethkingia meningoseptica]EOR30359.1 glyoxalase/bleomycin resistance protein/dioxygenase [Elizabethkingia meningoseptica ATCC 13253 = NBRC 12535]KUY24198.1 bleomycin resistance protein [Elizabethkingia meningoseptica]MDE5431100.1 VOC family protein [Elizabethkingia meningoseptica]